MALLRVNGVRLAGVVAVPGQVEVSNETLTLFTPDQRQRFIDTVGIRRRRVAAADTSATDLCLAAARRLCAGVALPPAQIGVLVFVTQTPDRPLPGNAMTAQHALGLTQDALLLDLHQGCAGYVYGLATLAAMLQAGPFAHGLLLAGDTLCRLLAPDDSSTVPLFSDAGSATLLSRDASAPPLHFNLGSDGGGRDVIHVPCAGAALRMGGMDVLNESLRHVPANVRELLAAASTPVKASAAAASAPGRRAGASPGMARCELAGGELPDYYVLHQANAVLNRLLAAKLGAPADRVPETLSDYGNTSVASIPLTLCARLGARLRRQQARVLLAGFGAGFSWGSALLRTPARLFCDMVECVSDDVGGS